MKKIIVFLMLTLLGASFAATGFSAPKIVKEIKGKISKKDDKKKNAKSVNVVLAKGIQINWCGQVVKDNGSVTIPGLEGVTLPVKKGKFDLTVPANPVFGDEEGLNQQSGFVELDFGTAKVYHFRIIYFSNSNASDEGEEKADGRGGISLKIYYSDKDVKGTIDGEPATLKKGWNIVGDKKELDASLMCAG